MTTLCRTLGTLVVSILPLTASAEQPPKQLWLYHPANLLVDKNIDKLQDIWTRASKAGYTHILLADSKFSRLPDMDKRYFANLFPTAYSI